jgi:hypothetical protein
MVSLLESEIKKQVASAFKGVLLPGTLRRVASTTVDSRGNPVPGTATTFSFEGIREKFNSTYAANVGIPTTDIKILIIAGLLDTDPIKDDQILIRGQWHQVRAILERDPANATHELQCFEIEDPT